jgi:hypothetical protein
VPGRECPLASALIIAFGTQYWHCTKVVYERANHGIVVSWTACFFADTEQLENYYYDSQ